MSTPTIKTRIVPAPPPSSSSWPTAIRSEHSNLRNKIFPQHKQDDDAGEHEEMFPASKSKINTKPKQKKSLSDALAEQEQRHNPFYFPSFQNDQQPIFGLEEIKPINCTVPKRCTVSYRKELQKRIEKNRNLAMVRFCSTHPIGALIAQAKRLHPDNVTQVANSTENNCSLSALRNGQNFGGVQGD